MQLTVKPDRSEQFAYNFADFPAYIGRGNIADFPNYTALGHWHDDLELIYIWKGRMRYCINDSHVVLKENDTLLVNVRRLHYGYSYAEKECRFSCVRFHPSLFAGNRHLREKYMDPILDNAALEYVHFQAVPSADAGVDVI